MRIAQVAPLYESVPPKYYGGTEHIVSYLTDELVRQGHDVTLFASGDSETQAKLAPLTHRSLRLDQHAVDHIAHHILLLERMKQQAGEFDVIHSHLGYLHFPTARVIETPVVSTQHGRLDLPDLQPMYAEFRELPNVSISDDQRLPMPWMNWVSTVYHGLPPDLYAFQPNSGSYFAFLGRISPEKRVDRAIAIASELGLPLRIAAKVDKVDVDYFETTIHPLLANPLIEFVGEIGEGEKADFLGGAIALLFPIDWPEPFGLVMIEAMSCGTPVIAYRRGSVPEVVAEGVTGYVVDGHTEAVEAAKRVGGLDRARIREVFEERFSVQRMAESYLEAYVAAASEPRRILGPPPDPEAATITVRAALPDEPRLKG